MVVFTVHAPADDLGSPSAVLKGVTPDLVPLVVTALPPSTEQLMVHETDAVPPSGAASAVTEIDIGSWSSSAKLQDGLPLGRDWHCWACNRLPAPALAGWAFAVPVTSVLASTALAAARITTGATAIAERRDRRNTVTSGPGMNTRK